MGEVGGEGEEGWEVATIFGVACMDDGEEADAAEIGVGG